MSLVEIRLPTALLLIGHRADFQPSVLRAGDRLRIEGEIARLAHDRAALDQLRRGWAVLVPSQPAVGLSHADLVRLLGRTIAAGRLDAALLPFDAPAPPPAALSAAPSRIVHVVDPDRTLLIAPAGHLPPEWARLVDRPAAAAAIRGLADGTPASRAIERQADRLWPEGLHLRSAAGATRQRLAGQLEAGGLTAAVLTSPIDRRRVALRDDAPQPVAKWDRDDRVAEALSRSREHLTGAVREAVEQMVSPESLAIMVGVFIAIALAQLTPISAATVDAVVLGIALALAGFAGVMAIGTLVDATVTAMNAKSEAEIDEAARLYAAAFVALGAVALSALLRKFVKKKGGAKPADEPAPRRSTNTTGSRDASRPVGRRGEPIDVKKGTNAETAIRGREYGGHAIDQMQGRGVPPSAVENAIRTGRKSADPIPGRTRYFDPVNKLTVVTEASGRVVTVVTGKLGK